MIMRNIEKIRKHYSLSSKLLIKTGLLVAIAGRIYVSGASFSAIVGIYLGYRILRLVLRFFGLVMALVFTGVSICVLIIIITLLIF
jgi:hypothetical protein